MIFETERLILRPFSEDDAESLYKYAKDPQVGPSAGWAAHTSAQYTREIIKTVLSEKDTYAVCLKEDGLAIGSIGLFSPTQKTVSIDKSELEIGYWIGVPFWGQGLIPEACLKLMEYAFTNLDCKRMWCGYYDGNEKSAKAQKKCGFCYHHTEENKQIKAIGETRTEHYTCITQKEWKAGHKKDNAVIYVHGKGGGAYESGQYVKFFPNYDVYGFDYVSSNPWEAKKEFREKVSKLSCEYNRVVLIAVSIGAYFSICSEIDKYISKAIFISPIVDMEYLIRSMMKWANISEEELEEKKVISTVSGEDLSYEYLQYVMHNKSSWNAPTYILAGSADILQSQEILQSFADSTKAQLIILQGSEHWIHLKEEIEKRDLWLSSLTGQEGF